MVSNKHQDNDTTFWSNTQENARREVEVYILFIEIVLHRKQHVGFTVLKGFKCINC